MGRSAVLASSAAAMPVSIRTRTPGSAAFLCFVDGHGIVGFVFRLVTECTGVGTAVAVIAAWQDCGRGPSAM